MDKVHAESAIRWQFLCANWNTTVNSQPFPEWVRSLDYRDIARATDIAMSRLQHYANDAPNTLNRPIGAGVEGGRYI